MEITTHIYEFDKHNEREYKNFIKNLRINDVIILKSLSSLGKTKSDIQKELEYLTKKVKVDIVVLDMPLFDTRINKDINGTLLVDLVIQTLACSNKIDTTIRKERQTEGIAHARASGVKFGRPAEPFPSGFNRVYNRFMLNEITKTQAANELGITFHKMSRFIERKTRELNNPA